MFSEKVNDRFILSGTAEALPFNGGGVGNGLTDFLFAGFVGVFFHGCIISKSVHFYNAILAF